MFRAGGPVTASSFHDRSCELQTVLSSFESLASGTPRWLALIGPRKVGKTSLLLEAARQSEEVAVVMVDAMERAPPTVEMFRTLTLRALDALLAERLGASLERRARDPQRFRRLLYGLDGFSADLRTELDRLATEPATPEALFAWLSLPEEVASQIGRRLVVAIDEVQELAQLQSRTFDPFPTLRAAWQHHQHVAYIISGSAPSALRTLVTDRHSPFFQHFHIVDVGPFEEPDSVQLLVSEAPPDRPIPPELATTVHDVTGGHPFYLQLFGEALVSSPPPYDSASLKPILQDEVFSRTGRLGLFFAGEYQRLVGRASTAAATLQAVAEHGPTRLTDVAAAIGASTASTARYLQRLGDGVQRSHDGRYTIPDPLFRLWLRWRSPGGTVVPMTVLGDEAEIAVARRLADLGFELVYQSRASRGAFDLLAIRGPIQLGVQVKSSRLPLRFPLAAWDRMQADAERFGWQWIVAHVGDGEVVLLDPSRCRRRREVRIDATAAIENLLRWLSESES